MVDRAIRSAMERVGSRRSLINDCPVCGRAVTPSHDRVAAWQGKYVHRGCAEYEPRHAARGRSRRVHTRFTRQ
jgi:hypothetical protein